MTRKRRRLYIVLASMLCLGVATALVLTAFQDHVVFAKTPGDVAAKPLPAGQRFRLLGLVEGGSVRKVEDGATTAFRVTDGHSTLEVTYRGVLPDLFREGQGVIAEGRLNDAGVFVAGEVLARHDENYMPKEVADAIKQSGQWKDLPPGRATAGQPNKPAANPVAKP